MKTGLMAKISLVSKFFWDTKPCSFGADTETIKYFTEGQCNALAWEIHKLTGFSLGLISDMAVGDPDYSGHMYVYNADGLIIDIRGVQEFDEFLKDWNWLTHVHRFMSTEAFELEMILWENQIHYTKDKEAKKWAKLIVDQL